MYTIYKRVKAGFETWSYVKVGGTMRNQTRACNKVDGFVYGGIVCRLGSNQPIYARG